MKKVLLLFVLLSAISQAQVFDKNVYFGLLFTTNGTVFKADPSIGTITPDFGYGGSAFLRLKKGAVFFEAEAGYLQHQVIVSPDIAGTPVKSNYSLAGADLTAMVGWRVIGIGKLGNFRVFAGFNYGNYSKVSIKNNGTQVNDASVNTGNSSIVGGLGVDLWKVVLNFKYIHGISDISNVADQKINSQCISASLGFKF